MNRGPHGQTGPLICWWCGYCLDGVDLMRSDMRCPECGKPNLPSNGPESPFVRRPWPRWWALLTMLCWPGAILGALDAGRKIAFPPEWAAGLAIGATVFILPAVAMCVLWAPMVAAVVVDDRIHGRVRTRVMLATAVGGIVGTFGLAGFISILATVVRELMA
jgi:hypothetical protein